MHCNRKLSMHTVYTAIGLQLIAIKMWESGRAAVAAKAGRAVYQWMKGGAAQHGITLEMKAVTRKVKSGLVDQMHGVRNQQSHGYAARLQIRKSPSPATSCNKLDAGLQQTYHRIPLHEEPLESHYTKSLLIFL